MITVLVASLITVITLYVLGVAIICSYGLNEISTGRGYARDYQTTSLRDIGYKKIRDGVDVIKNSWMWPAAACGLAYDWFEGYMQDIKKAQAPQDKRPT